MQGFPLLGSFRIDIFGNSPECTLPGQPAFTRVLDRSQDTLLRDSGWVLGSTPASGVGGGATPPPELVTSYAYNPTDGRLETIRGGGLHPPSQFSYSYTAFQKCFRFRERKFKPRRARSSQS